MQNKCSTIRSLKEHALGHHPKQCKGIAGRSKVIIIAQNQPLDNDAHLRRKMASAESRAQRQSSRFPGLDLYAIQREVNRNILKSALVFDDRYMDLLDLMNYIKNGRRVPELTPADVKQYYSLANSVTLNGIYLFQYLAEHGFCPIIVQNYSTANLSDLLREGPLAVCISSNFIYMEDIKDIAVQIKQFAPDVAVIAGGMLVKKALNAGEELSANSLRFFSTFFRKIDAFVIEAQGEQTLVKLLQAVSKGEDLGRVPNLGLFDDKGKLVFTPREKEGTNMDGAAISWDRVPRGYLRKILPVNSSRGCFYRCRFCTYHWLFPDVLYKSVDVLRQELKLIDGLGFVEHIRFTDDNFTANRKRLKAVLQMMLEERLGFTWSSFARASSLTPELVRLMKQAGCEFVDLGLESGSQTILDNMDKRLRREQSLSAIEMLNDHGIYGRGSFIIGYPGETRETFSETIEFIKQSGLPYYHPYLFYYTANTLVHKMRDELGMRGLGLAWRHDTMDAAEASDLMSQMVLSIDSSFTDGQTYVEEIYKLLRGEGYRPNEILELFRLKRELQLTIKEFGSREPFSPRVGEVLVKLESLVR
jgi:anaerobic magnesium-protoporphyrin IX monomethyl ester cyclase